MTVNELDLIRT